MRAVEALRAELEEEEQALGGTEAGNMSEDAQSEEASSHAESESAQQASPAAAGDAESDEGHATSPDPTRMLIANPCTPSGLRCTGRKTLLHCTSAMSLPSIVLVSTSASACMDLHASCMSPFPLQSSFQRCHSHNDVVSQQGQHCMLNDLYDLG